MEAWVFHPCFLAGHAVTYSFCAELDHDRLTQARSPSSARLLMLSTALRNCWEMTYVKQADQTLSTNAVCLCLWLFIFISANIDTRHFSQESQDTCWIHVQLSGSGCLASRSLGCTSPTAVLLFRFLLVIFHCFLKSSLS